MASREPAATKSDPAPERAPQIVRRAESGGALAGLQHAVGNQAVTRMLGAQTIQAKLRSGAPSGMAEESVAPTTEQATEDETPSTENGTEAGALEPAVAAAPLLLVDDEAEQIQPEQMRKSDFLATLRDAVCATANEGLASAGQTTSGCPWVEYWFGYAADQDAAYVEKAIRKYAPDTAGAATAGEMIPIVTARVRQSVDAWVRTGEITGVPEEFSGAAMQEPGAGSPAGTPRVLFKARPGGARHVNDASALRDQLGRGTPLAANVRSRMEAAFGTNFSNVRIHDDSTANQVSDGLNARAFTIGNHVAFSSREYRPGTLVGDALIAHELAHVVQQGHASAESTPDDGANRALEQDADRSAWSAVASQAGLKSPAWPTMPRLTTGLRLSRCSKKETAKPTTAKSLRHVATSHQPHGTWGYMTNITYEVLDDKGNPVKGFDVNEKFPSGAVNDDPTTNWRQGDAGGVSSTTTQFTDTIGGEASTYLPTPQAPQTPLGNQKIQHWEQEWYIGSTTPGVGTKVQTDTIQKYRDHADHDNVKSPP